MATKKEYNGWFNYETWLVNLWTDNSFSKDARSAYENATADRYNTREQAATYALAEQIQAYVEEMNPSPESGMFADLINAALSEVNWQEIAEHYIYDLDKSEFEDEELEEVE